MTNIKYTTCVTHNTIKTHKYSKHPQTIKGKNIQDSKVHFILIKVPLQEIQTINTVNFNFQVFSCQLTGISLLMKMVTRLPGNMHQY